VGDRKLAVFEAIAVNRSISPSHGLGIGRETCRALDFDFDSHCPGRWHDDPMVWLSAAR
jgi:hypothetical protein